MPDEVTNNIKSVLITIIADGFNRSIQALEDAGAIDTTEMRKAYKGIGSEYYDLVSAAIEYTAEVSAPALKKALAP